MATSIVVSVAGCILFFTLAAYIPTLTKRLLDDGVRDAVIWGPDSPAETDDRYRSNAGPGSDPDVVSLYLFNLTNVEEMRKGEKPVLEEVGPFVYQKVLTKMDVQWAEDGTLSAKDYLYFDLIPSLTKVDVNVKITTLNLALIGVVEGVHASVSSHFYESFVDFCVSLLASRRNEEFNGLFTTRTANELIWGYEDPLLHRLEGWLPAGSIPTTRVELMHNMTSVEEALDAPVTVYDTGEKDINNLWQVLSFDGGLKSVSCWNNCSERVQGTDGTQFTPGVKRAKQLKVWTPPLLRASSFDYLKDVNVDGVKLLRFQQSPADSEIDECHYQSIKGIMNLTIPRAVGGNGTKGQAVGPPVYISKPHYCDCDPSLSHAVEGMHCEPERHTMFLDVEPITGISMQAQLRVMLSSEMTEGARRHFEPRLDKATAGRTLIPIFWMDEYGRAPVDALDKFKGTVYRFLSVSTIIWWVCMLIGVLLLLVALIMIQRQFGAEGQPTLSHIFSADPSPNSSHPSANSQRSAKQLPTSIPVDVEDGTSLTAPLLEPSSSQ